MTQNRIYYSKFTLVQTQLFVYKHFNYVLQRAISSAMFINSSGHEKLQGQVRMQTAFPQEVWLKHKPTLGLEREVGVLRLLFVKLLGACQ